MANDGSEGENLPKNDCTEESIESLRKEVERLKTRLEEERKKLNDVTCKASPLTKLLAFRGLPLTHPLGATQSLLITLSYSVSSAAERLDNVSNLNIKPRRVLKGHQGKVLCSDWSYDNRHIVSSSQDGKLIIWDAFTTNKVRAVPT